MSQNYAKIWFSALEREFGFSIGTALQMDAPYGCILKALIITDYLITFRDLLKYNYLKWFG